IRVWIRHDGPIRQRLFQPRLAPRPGAARPRGFAHHRGTGQNRHHLRSRFIGLYDRRTRVPSEIRLWPYRRGGRQQAAGRFRESRLQARHGRLRRQGMTAPPIWKACVTVPKALSSDVAALFELSPPAPQAVLIAEDPFGPDAIVEALYNTPADADFLSRL